MCALESIRLYMGGSIGKGKHAGMHGTDIWSVGDKGIVLVWICHKEARQMSMVSTTKVRMDGNGIGFQFKLHLVQ